MAGEGVGTEGRANISDTVLDLGSALYPPVQYPQDFRIRPPNKEKPNVVGSHLQKGRGGGQWGP